jgi:hypothetical protein
LLMSPPLRTRAFYFCGEAKSTNSPCVLWDSTYTENQFFS